MRTLVLSLSILLCLTQVCFAAEPKVISETLRDGYAHVKELAEQGDAIAQGELGWLYSMGQGVPRDDKEAAKWYRKAAEQGDANAQRELGNLYGFGQGVPRDDKEAAKWYAKAAEQGNVVALSFSWA